MVKQEGQPTVKIERFHFSTRLKTVIFPFQYNDLTPLLEEIGYPMLDEIKRRLPEVPSGARLSIGGVIAETKDKARNFRLDPERGILAIQGREIQKVLKDFVELEELVASRLLVKIENESMFYEFILDAEVLVGPNRNPINTISKLYSDSNYLTKFTSILGKSVTNFGIRLVESKLSPSSETWTDIIINPSVSKATTHYFINVVFRRGSRNEVTQMAGSIEQKILQLIEAMEPEG